MWAESTEFPHSPSRLSSPPSPVNIEHSCGAFVTIDEPISTHHYQLRCMVYISVCSMGLDKCWETCVHHCGTVKSDFTVLRFTWALPVDLFLLTMDCFIVLIILPLPEYPIVGIIVCNLFRLASFTWQHAFQLPICLFMAVVAHFFASLFFE